GARANCNSEERHSPDAEQRDVLRERKRLSQRIAERVPWETAEQMAAQPLADRERDRERDNTQRSAHPEQPRQRQAEAGVEGEIGGQTCDRERQQPSERLCIDQKGVSDPVEP